MNSIALPRSCPQDVLKSGYVVLLKQTGLLSAEGDDAVRFVHGQLSNDIEHLGPGSVRVAAYCTPQGRMLALFHIWKSGGKVCMMLPRDILPALQKRLQIYILRAKVKLADESDSMAILGIGGRKAETVLSEWFPGLSLALFGKTENETGVLMRVKDAFGAPRYLLAVPSCKLQEMESALSAKLAVCDESGWLLGDIEAGMPQITLPVQDRFIPQMVNLEETGGLSFKKGCYPGQEVIARSDYLSVNTPLTPETRGMFGAKEFAAMKQGAVFINIARGPVADARALAAALKSGHLGGAGIDVYDSEPCTDSPLRECENAVLTPHTSTFTGETRLLMARAAAQNVLDWERGALSPRARAA